MSNQALLSWDLISGDVSSLLSCGFSDQDVLQLKGIFKSVDSNRDGLLTSPEVIKAFNFVGLSPKQSSIDEYFVDENGMQIPGIEFEAFLMILAYEKKHFAKVKEQIDCLFDFIDEDKTGYITVKELEQLLTADASPYRFTKLEFASFLKSLDCGATTAGSSNQQVSVGLLKKKLLFSV